MTKVEKALYAGKTHTYAGKIHTVCGRESGSVRSSDGRLNVGLSNPDSAGVGTNPEQLFAAAWSASFKTAIGLAARKRGLTLPAQAAVYAEVDLNLAKNGYFLSARLNISLPGVEHELARTLMAEANQICPYSKATSGNIDLAINLV
jgi:lipoyl-dependent peroxiredoxin